jgi:hypothetical protein
VGSGNGLGGLWYQSMGSAQWFSQFGPTRAQLQVRGSNVYLIGNEANSPNVSARVYDCLAIVDKTRRCFTSTEKIMSTTASWDNENVPLVDAEGEDFQPELLLGVLESAGTSVSGYVRGPADIGDLTSLIVGNAAPVANVFQAIRSDGFQLGNLFPGVSGGAEFVVGALRSNFFGPAFMSILTYTGDGTGTRTLTLNQPGFTPTWVLIITRTTTGGVATNISTPSNAAGRSVGTGVTISGTIASVGVNSVTVGANLNASGQTFSVLAFALGTDVAPEPEPDPTPFPGPPLPAQDPIPSTTNATLLLMRRLRRFPHLSQEDFRIFYQRIQFDMETGVGLPGLEVVGSAPQVMLRWSDDGGMTWSSEHWVSIGRVGSYSTRAIFNRLGQGRDRVFEMAVSDPVAWRFVDAYLDLVLGTS